MCLSCPWCPKGTWAGTSSGELGRFPEGRNASSRLSPGSRSAGHTSFSLSLQTVPSRIFEMSQPSPCLTIKKKKKEVSYNMTVNPNEGGRACGVCVITCLHLFLPQAPELTMFMFSHTHSHDKGILQKCQSSEKICRHHVGNRLQSSEQTSMVSDLYRISLGTWFHHSVIKEITPLFFLSSFFKNGGHFLGKAGI